VSQELNNPNLKKRRRELRKNQTDAEKMLWQKLRNQRLRDLKFFRQYSVGPFILDFYCPKIRLAIELDGGGHNHEEARVYDFERTAYLKTQDIKVLRFWNHEVFKNLDEVLGRIASECSKKE
jgi:very-short-patch-repair endonuclease